MSGNISAVFLANTELHFRSQLLSHHQNAVVVRLRRDHEPRVETRPIGGNVVSHVPRVDLHHEHRPDRPLSATISRARSETEPLEHHKLPFDDGDAERGVYKVQPKFVMILS